MIYKVLFEGRMLVYQRLSDKFPGLSCASSFFNRGFLNPQERFIWSLGYLTPIEF